VRSAGTASSTSKSCHKNTCASGHCHSQDWDHQVTMFCDYCTATTTVSTGTKLANWLNNDHMQRFLLPGHSVSPTKSYSDKCDCNQPDDCQTPEVIPTGCHPAHTELEVHGGHMVRIGEVTPGTLVHTPSGFQPVLGFLHAEAQPSMPYLRFTTPAGIMEISREHWVFVNGVETDPQAVAVGDELQSPSGPARVERIELVNEQGAYHPFVAGGAYYANGLLASDYNAHVPMAVWQAVRGYVRLRYHLGVPVIPESKGVFSRPFWAFDLLDTFGMPSRLQALFFPVLVPTAIVTELLNLLLRVTTASKVGASALALILLVASARYVLPTRKLRAQPSIPRCD